LLSIESHEGAESVVKVISVANKHRFAPLLDSMFRDRKTTFVDKLKWNVPVVDGIYEKDQFDNDDAVYLVATNREGNKHISSMRLLPTSRPHLLSDVFPQLCDGELPRGEDIWEVSRICTAPDLKEDARTARRHMSIALIEFALLYGATRLTLVSHMEYLSRLLALGWECRPLGYGKEVFGQAMGAMEISVTQTTLDMVRKMFGNGVRVPVLELEGVSIAA
jgi:N-acyl-L-homoserine lactone synthetase